MKQQQFNALIESIKDTTAYISDMATHEILYMTESAAHLFNLQSPEDYHGKKCYQLLHEVDRPCTFCANGRLMTEETYSWTQYNHKLKQWILVDDEKISVDGRPCRLETMTPISPSRTWTKKMQKQLKSETVLLQCLQTLSTSRNLHSAIDSFLGMVGRFYWADRSYIFEFDLEKNTFSNLFEWCRSGVSSSAVTLQNISLSYISDWLTQFKERGEVSISSIYNELPQDTPMRRLLEKAEVNHLMLIPLYSENQITGFIGVDNPKANAGDNTLLRASSDFIAVEMERRRNKERLEFLSSTDSLTGVYNRERYIRELSERYQNVPARLGIIVADINGLHLLNERYGHQFGDSVIIRTASILKEILPYDVYRIAGDEFIIPCVNVSKEELEADLERLRQAFAKEIDYNVSLGYSWKDGSINIDQQIQVANMMMASNKQVYYHDARQKGVLNNESFTAEILREIESGCFTVQYQPQIDLSTGTIVAAEALVRKYCKDGDLIPPGTFIPYYESRNVLMHLDIHVLDMVLADLRKLQDEGLPMVPVAVNLSRSTLLMTDFLPKVLDKFEKHGLPTSCITLEVTESISTIGREFLRDLLNEIHAAGLRLSLDDFGTQYSNTVILSDFCFDEVKFDRSLVAALHQNKRNQIILKNLINMCHEFPNTVVLAEGVETQIQADLLQKLGCDLVQGYHYYRPMSFEPFRELLQSKDPAEPVVSSIFPFNESNPPFSLLSKEGLSVKDELFSIMDVVLSTLLKNSSDMVFIKDKDLRYVNASTPFIRMLGRESSHEVIGHTDEELFDNPDLAARYTADDRRLFAGGVDLVNFTEPLPAVDGRPRYSLTSKYILRDSVGDILGVLGISRDITSEYRIRQNYQHELKYMFNLSPDTYAAIYIDVDAWRIINKRKQLLNNWSMPFYDSISEFAGDALRHVVDHKSEAYSYYSSLSPKTLREIYSQGNRSYVIEYLRKMPDGTMRWIRNETQFLTDPITGHLCTMWIVSDINDQKTQEHQSKAVMETDKMTGLLNRHFTEQYIHDFLEESKATPSIMSHALLVMDVDNFKALNDTKGHPAGDAFLADLGKAIKKSFRDTDIVGRMGGDEFFVFMKDVGSRENVESKVGSLFRLLQPIFNEQEVPGLSCSVGIALYGEDGSTLEDLYALADQALYHAKRTGKNRMVFAEDTK